MSTHTTNAANPLSVLKQYWGYTSFRPLQQQIIDAILQGSDVLALLPTGGGKSVCYQVPALLKPGICLVISPLIALMKDQVDNLRKKGITAFAVYSGMSRKEVLQTLSLATESNCKFLYVSPERLETALFKDYLPVLDISLVAVDEAHCISQWGYDFRPPYLRIAALRELLPEVPVLALTASATKAVQKDIAAKLLFKNSQTFQQSFARPNLSYSVFAADSKINKLVAVLTNVPGSSIVYCKTRRLTKEISTQLQSYGIAADFYHAGLTTSERSEKQSNWIHNKTRVMVCTNAFGMGIDKPDVRSVIHYNLPDCLENYYQEAGRAGRDGIKSYAVLLYHTEEISQLKEQVKIKYPAVDYLRTVYQTVMNYLQLPTGTFENASYDFDLISFCKKFELTASAVLPALKILEQEGYLAFSEQVFIPAKAQFVCNKEMLYLFEKEQPALEPVIKILLRSYGGIFDQETMINEKSVAFWLQSTEEQVKKQLQQLHANHIINYQPQKDKPQVYLLQERITTAYLSVNEATYTERRKQYEERLQHFINYFTNTTACRSRYIGNYFGDAALQDCGVCDNCLNKKKTLPVTAAVFQQLQAQLDVLLIMPMPVNDLLAQLKGISKPHAWQVLDFLQAENKISITDDGLVRKAK